MEGPEELYRLAKSFERHLKAEAKSDKTVHTYGEAVNQLIRHVAAAGIERARDIKREHIEEYVVGVLDSARPGRFATANNRFRSLQQWFKWLMREEIIHKNPMAEMSPPKVPEKPIPLHPLNQEGCPRRGIARDPCQQLLGEGTNRLCRWSGSAR
ncbi:MAG TPA: phage integrase N-terminal SAM-like domain-containing protein [Acidimicrobiales bacterium]|nr:phage integrase N-terminal SAM-like domain-containing protein [Acidimicrobiales bacterium]